MSKLGQRVFSIAVVAQIAFEAFTVIENMYGVISDEVIDQEIAKINNALQQADEEKAYLLRGLVTIIRDIPEKSEFSE